MERYDSLEPLGSGGQGRVFRARDTLDGSIVAVKIMNASVVGNMEYAKAFDREARLAASLEHPNIVRVSNFGVQDFGIEKNMPFIAMELVPDALDKVLKADGPMPYKQAVDIAIRVCLGLTHAHGKMVHRDLKPSNILLTSDWTPKISDLGIARALESSTHAYQSNAGQGTYAYMSPEQWDGGGIRPTADLYSLGITLYEMITGSVPFKGPGFGEYLRQHKEAPVPPFPENLMIPEALEAVVRKALEKDPNDRFRDAVAMAAALTASLTAPKVAPDKTEVSPEVAQGSIKPDVAKVASQPTPQRRKAQLPAPASQSTVAPIRPSGPEPSDSNSATGADWNLLYSAWVFGFFLFAVLIVIDVFTGSSGWSNLDWAHWPILGACLFGYLCVWGDQDNQALPLLVYTLTIPPIVAIIFLFGVQWSSGPDPELVFSPLQDEFQDWRNRWVELYGEPPYVQAGSFSKGISIQLPSCGIVTAYGGHGFKGFEPSRSVALGQQEIVLAGEHKLDGSIWSNRPYTVEVRPPKLSGIGSVTKKYNEQLRTFLDLCTH